MDGDDSLDDFGSNDFAGSAPCCVAIDDHDFVLRESALVLAHARDWQTRLLALVLWMIMQSRMGIWKERVGKRLGFRMVRC